MQKIHYVNIALVVMGAGLAAAAVKAPGMWAIWIGIVATAFTAAGAALGPLSPSALKSSDGGGQP